MFDFSVTRLLFLLISFASLACAQDTLELNKPTKRDLSVGQSHAYALTLGAQQFLNLIVEQQGIDVEVALFGPDDKPVAKLDASGSNGTEALSVVAAVTGSYRLVVQPADAKAKPGAYQITMLALRPATVADQAVGAAFASYLESLAFIAQKKNAEAIAAQEKALAQLEQQFASDATALQSLP
ncbi:MAG TPA: hypothetical protein VFZ34_29880, partial [Blastocatellia bacterium]|nr:hypothetical protein [Blastocatellia bacterium]